MRLVRSVTHAGRDAASVAMVRSGLVAVALALAGCGGGSSSSVSPQRRSSSTGKPGGTFTILANSNFGVADPAQNYTLQEWQLLIDTHDGLAGFAKVGGVAGTKIVPDLATSIPLPTNGGKTYVFHIRKGIKFSNGQVLKPSDFVTTFERQFTVPGPTSFYSDIVGASACSTKGCDLSKGVVANDSAYTLTINLTAPDPELMDQLALPFAYRGAVQHLAEADRQQRAAGHRAVHVEVVQPEHRGGAGPQPVLQAVERGRPSRPATRTRSSRSTACRSPTR